MTIRKVAFWLVALSLPFAFVYFQSLLLFARPKSLGYSVQKAAVDTYEIYAQFQDDQRLLPAVDQVRQLGEEYGQIEKFWVGGAKRGRDGTPTFVTATVTRREIRYVEKLYFEADGTFIKIVSTEHADAD